MISNQVASFNPWALLVPVGIAFFVFLANRHLGRQSSVQKLLADDVEALRLAVQKTGEMIRRHQGGRPCDGCSSLIKSRIKICEEMRRLSMERGQIESQIPEEFANELKLRHLEWKDNVQGDRGIVVAKPYLHDYELDMIDTQTVAFCAWLKNLRHDVVRCKVPVICRI